VWSKNPQPWHLAVDIALMFGSPFLTYIAPDYMKTDISTRLLCGALVVSGMVSFGVDKVAMGVNHWKNSVKDVRMFNQPTEEEKKTEEERIRQMAEKYTVAKTNYGTGETAVYTPGNVQKVPAGFAAMQNTAEVVRLAAVDNAIRKICRRTLVLVSHPDLGFPSGDFREVTWVATKEMSRNILLLAMAILESHGGVARANGNANATRIVKDLEVIKRGARESLPHPVGCWCADCKE
jgi:hypothetical protein